MRFFIFIVAIVIPIQAYAGVCGGLNPVLVVATPLSFGNYDASSLTDTQANATITTSCTVTLDSTLPSFSVAISAGGSNSFTARHLTYLTQTLNYNLYTSATYSTIWGDGTSPTATQSYSTGDGLATKSYTVYGSIPAHQYVGSGIYLDTPIITVTY